MIPQKLCDCGCGELIDAYRIHGKKHIPRYIKNGHNNRGKTWDKNPNWRGGRVIQWDYVLVRCLDHPRAVNGYVREHILVMEKYIGRYVRIDEDVHHIDGDTRDNRIENLQLMTHGEHSTITHTKKIEVTL
jgi:hypothetical protein